MYKIYLNPRNLKRAKHQALMEQIHKNIAIPFDKCLKRLKRVNNFIRSVKLSVQDQQTQTFQYIFYRQCLQPILKLSQQVYYECVKQSASQKQLAIIKFNLFPIVEVPHFDVQKVAEDYKANLQWASQFSNKIQAKMQVAQQSQQQSNSESYSKIDNLNTQLIVQKNILVESQSSQQDRPKPLNKNFRNRRSKKLHKNSEDQYMKYERMKDRKHQSSDSEQSSDSQQIQKQSARSQNQYYFQHYPIRRTDH